jgi:hypothetical protein
MATGGRALGSSALGESIVFQEMPEAISLQPNAFDDALAWLSAGYPH